MLYCKIISCINTTEQERGNVNENQSDSDTSE